MPSFSSLLANLSPSATLALNAQAKRLGEEGKKVINFTVGELDAPSSPSVKKAGIKAIQDNFTYYTETRGIYPLREAIANYYRTEWAVKQATAENVLVSNGGKQILSMLFAVLLDEGDEVIMGSPYWTSYPEEVKLARGVPCFVSTDEQFILRANTIEKAITSKTKIIVINSPANPTGAIIPKTELVRILELAKKHNVWIISDEVYLELYFTKNKPVSLGALGRDTFNNVIIASSVSKMAAMTGWRIGFAIGHHSVVKALDAYQSHFSSAPCSVSQRAAVAAFSASGLLYTSKLRSSLEKRRDIVIKALLNIRGLNVYSPPGAFYAFVRVSEKIVEKTKGRFCEELLDKYHVATVPGSALSVNYTNYFRLSFAVSESMLEEGLSRIRKFIDTL